MRAGRLRHRVSIEQPTAGEPNDYGETVDAWTEYVGTWVDVVPQTAREYRDAAGVRGEMTHLLGMRYDSGITNQMRVVYDGRTLNIVAVIDVGERRRELRLVCVEEV